MKKLTKLLELICIIVICFSLFSINNAFDNIKIESYIEYFSNRLCFNSPQVNLGKNMFTKDNNLSSYKYNLCLSSLNYLPIELLDFLKNENKVTGHITNNSIYEFTHKNGITLNIDKNLNIDKKNISGLYMPKDKKILMSTKYEYIFNFQHVLVHESGHSFDYLYNDENLLSSEDSFLRLYNSKEKENLFYYDDYYTKNEKEYFAESFSLYFINPTYLKTKAPNTYDYFDTLISNFIQTKKSL